VVIHRPALGVVEAGEEGCRVGSHAGEPRKEGRGTPVAKAGKFLTPARGRWTGRYARFPAVPAESQRGDLNQWG
jgi:hypothetical protein